MNFYGIKHQISAVIDELYENAKDEKAKEQIKEIQAQLNEATDMGELLSITSQIANKYGVGK